MQLKCGFLTVNWGLRLVDGPKWHVQVSCCDKVCDLWTYAFDCPFQYCNTFLQLVYAFTITRSRALDFTNTDDSLCVVQLHATDRLATGLNTIQYSMNLPECFLEHHTEQLQLATSGLCTALHLVQNTLRSLQHIVPASIQHCLEHQFS